MSERPRLDGRYILGAIFIVLIFFILTRNIKTAFSVLILLDFGVAGVLAIRGLSSGDHAQTFVGCICALAALGAIKPIDEIGFREVLMAFLSGAVGLSTFLLRSARKFM